MARHGAPSSRSAGNPPHASGADSPGPSRRKRPLSLIRLDGARIRAAVEQQLKKQRTELLRLQAQVTRFEQVELPGFYHWICKSFGPLRSQIVEAGQKIEANELLIHRVTIVSMALCCPAAEAYGRIQDEIAGKGPAIPKFAEPEPPRQGKKSTEADPDDDFDDDDPESMLKDFFDMFLGPDADGPERGGRAGSQNRSDALTSAYRTIVKQLHPDRGTPMTEEERALWLTAQNAYKSGNLGVLQSCLAKTRSLRPEAALQETVASMQDQLREIRRSARNLRGQVAKMKKDPAWDFSKKKNNPIYFAVTQRRLEDELERTLLDLEESEREIAVLDAKYRAWCSRSRSRQDAGGRSGPKRRRT